MDHTADITVLSEIGRMAKIINKFFHVSKYGLFYYQMQLELKINLLNNLKKKKIVFK